MEACAVEAGAVGTGAPFRKDGPKSIHHISRAALPKDKRPLSSCSSHSPTLLGSGHGKAMRRGDSGKPGWK